MNPAERNFSRRDLLAASLAAAAGSMGGISLGQAKAPPKPAPAAKPRLGTDERSKWFATARPVLLSIELSPENLESLRKEPKKYVKCNLREVGGAAYKDVGLKLKGAAGSFRPIDEKPGLTVNMDKYAKGQAFHGIDKFHLNNCAQDGSYVSEMIAGEIYRAAGVPASRCGHAGVQLNGRTLGFYLLKEGYDSTFLKTRFGNDDGNFYDGGFLREIDQPLEVDEGKNGVKEYGDLKAVFEACQIGDHAKRLTEMERLLDLPKFITYLAIQVLTWDWDGYPMKRNNYRLYHDPAKNKLTFIPSGMDQLWGEPAGPITPDFEGIVARNLLETTEGRKRYFMRMNQLLREVYLFAPLNKRLDELQARVQPALKLLDEGAGNDYPNQINRIRDGIRMRIASALDQLKKVKP